LSWEASDQQQNHETPLSTEWRFALSGSFLPDFFVTSSRLGRPAEMDSQRDSYSDLQKTGGFPCRAFSISLKTKESLFGTLIAISKAASDVQAADKLRSAKKKKSDPRHVSEPSSRPPKGKPAGRV
jgi:hypothetical protein